MGVSLGSLGYLFKANNMEFKQKMGEVRKTLNETNTKLNDSKKHIKNYGQAFTDNIKKLSEWSKKHKEAIQTVAVGGGAALAGLVLEIRKATKENVEFTNSLIGLRSIAEGTGQDLDKTTQAAEDLAADGLMNVADAATGLKNLLLAGFGLDEAVVLMERFKDSAAFGRQGALSFGEAIKSATEGVKNGNSILVNICPARRQLLAA